MREINLHVSISRLICDSHAIPLPANKSSVCHCLLFSSSVLSLLFGVWLDIPRFSMLFTPHTFASLMPLFHREVTWIESKLLLKCSFRCLFRWFSFVRSFVRMRMWKCSICVLCDVSSSVKTIRLKSYSYIICSTIRFHHTTQYSIDTCYMCIHVLLLLLSLLRFVLVGWSLFICRCFSRITTAPMLFVTENKPPYGYSCRQRNIYLSNFNEFPM